MEFTWWDRTPAPGVFDQGQKCTDLRACREANPALGGFKFGPSTRCQPCAGSISRIGGLIAAREHKRLKPIFSLIWVGADVFELFSDNVGSFTSNVSPEKLLVLN
jgi:hypothetical protein